MKRKSVEILPSNSDTVFELGPRYVGAQVLSRPRPPRYDDLDAGSAAAGARGVSGGARRATAVQEAVAVCTRGRLRKKIR